jgi:hypothetical protein
MSINIKNTPLFAVDRIMNENFKISKDVSIETTIEAFLEDLQIDTIDEILYKKVLDIVKELKSKGLTDAEMIESVKQYLSGNNEEDVSVESGKTSWLSVIGYVVGACAIAGIAYCAWSYLGSSDQVVTPPIVQVPQVATVTAPKVQPVVHTYVPAVAPVPAVVPVASAAKPHSSSNPFAKLGNAAKQKIGKLAHQAAIKINGKKGKSQEDLCAKEVYKDVIVEYLDNEVNIANIRLELLQELENLNL